MSNAITGGTAGRPRELAATRRAAWLGLGLFCGGFAVLEVVNHGMGALAMAAGFAIAPDLTMLIGARQRSQPGQLAPRAVPWYNAVHRAWMPLLLLAVSVVTPLASAPLFAGGLGWLAHITIDRAAGFGLRNAAGFQRPQRPAGVPDGRVHG